MPEKSCGLQVCAGRSGESGALLVGCGDERPDGELGERNDLIGAQRTASEVERRVVANRAVRVVGRLDSAEAGRDQHGFLPAVQRRRATILKPRSMFVSQPRVPVPLLLEFPFPAWGPAHPRRT